MHTTQAAAGRYEGDQYSLQRLSSSLQVLIDQEKTSTQHREEEEDVAPADDEIMMMMMMVRPVPAMAFNEEVMMRLSAGRAVVVFGMSDCCMCHVAKQLLIGLGVNPGMVDLDQLLAGSGSRSARFYADEIMRTVLICCSSRPPVVFVGGKLLGGIESLIASHINGFLVPLLKDAGALWL